VKTLLFDFETRSRCDLKTAGHRRYAADPSTQITCVAWQWREQPGSLRGAVAVPGFERLAPASIFDFIVAVSEADSVVCHNAGFDVNVLRGVFGIAIPPEKISCTMARAQRISLPGGLDAIAEALGLEGKSKGGGLLVMRTCKPQRSGEFLEDADTFRDLLAYCMQDVRALAAIDARLPELPPDERRIYERTWRKNELGLPVDVALAEAIAARRADIERACGLRLRDLTGHAVTEITQAARIQKWLVSQGVFLPDARRETVEEALEDEDLPADAREVLEMRRDSGGMAPSKAQALLDRQLGGAYKDATRYYGARSGRGTSEGVNTFNISRPSGEYDVESTIAALKLGFAGAVNNTALSDCLRGVICAPPGWSIVDADLSNIELRLAMWFAGAEDILSELRKPDGDPYIANAIKMFGLPADASKHTHKKERQNAKPLVLGGNYAMGHKRFFALYRRQIEGLTLERAQAWIDRYRSANPELAGRAGLWRALDQAAREAHWRPGAVIEAAAGKVAFQQRLDPAMNVQTLYLRLPDGREIPHYAPDVDRESGEFSFMRGRHGKMLRQRAFGGSWLEIMCQSAARSIICRVESIIEEEMPDVSLRLDVYDSVVFLAPATVAEERLRQALDIMRRPIPWALGLPTFGEGYVAERMAK